MNVRTLIHRAEVMRWRLSKAMGVPGLERIRWSCIAWGVVSIALGVSGALDLLMWAQTAQSERPPAVAIWNVWVQIGMMVVAALVSYALRPRQEPPQPAQQQAPVAEDGTSIREVWGTVWIDSPMELAWRALEPIAIRKKGGKK